MNSLDRIALRERILDKISEQDIDGVLTLDDQSSLADAIMDVITDEEGATDALDDISIDEDLEN